MLTPLPVLASVVLAFLIAVVPALGQRGGGSQPRRMTTEPVVTAADVAGFHRVMGTSEEQRAAAGALFEAYRADVSEVRRAVAERRAAVARPERGAPPEAWEGYMRASRAMAREQLAEMGRLREALLADLRLLLTAEQDREWLAYERFLRREFFIAEAPVTGSESANLLLAAERAGLSAASAAAVAPTLEKYERELDAILVEQGVAFERFAALLFADGPMEETVPAVEAAQREVDAAAPRVRRLNRATLEALCRSVGPDEAERLREAYVRMAAPFLRPHEGVVALRAAGESARLSADERREAVAMAGAWAAEVERFQREVPPLWLRAEDVGEGRDARAHAELMRRAGALQREWERVRGRFAKLVGEEAAAEWLEQGARDAEAAVPGRSW